MTDFQWLIDVNAGGFRLKKGQGVLHPIFGPLGPYECPGKIGKIIPAIFPP